MNTHCFYVIGLNKYCLFDITWQFNWSSENPDYLIKEIAYGDISPELAYHFEELNDVKKAIEEIVQRYNEIFTHRLNTFDAIINGNDFNPNNIKTYKVWYSMKEIERG